MSYSIFDLETKYLFQDIDSNYRNYSWAVRKKLDKEIIPKLGLSVGGIMFPDGEYMLFEEGNEKALISELENQKKIVGYNVVGFDFSVLSRFDQDIGQRLEPKTTDMMLEIERVTGCWPKLDDLSSLNLGMQKTIDTLKIPGMWRSGKNEERTKVKDYLQNDLEITKRLYTLGLEKKKLKFTRKNYGRVVGVEEFTVNW